MTYYHQEIIRIKGVCYDNQGQLNTVVRLRNYINHHFCEDLNLDKISLVHFTSKFHLLRLFQKYYGQTPLQYATDCRLRESKRRLLLGQTIKETCYEIGFESPSSFITLFKRRFHMSPGEFQKRAIFTNAGKDKS